MIAAVADTHVALWYLFDDVRLSPTARGFLTDAARSRQQIAVSSISLAELVYLTEKGRLPLAAYDDLVAALADPEHLLTEAAFTASVVESMRGVPRSAIPDMPDRMIAATAVHLDVPVISRDGKIRSSEIITIW